MIGVLAQTFMIASRADGFEAAPGYPDRLSAGRWWTLRWRRRATAG